MIAVLHRSSVPVAAAEDAAEDQQREEASAIANRRETTKFGVTAFGMAAGGRRGKGDKGDKKGRDRFMMTCFLNRSPFEQSSLGSRLSLSRPQLDRRPKSCFIRAFSIEA